MEKNNKKIINLVGWGFVGQATGIGLKRLGYNVFAYDIKKKDDIYGEKEFKEIPLIIDGSLPKDGINIVCMAETALPDGRQELRHIAKVLNNLKPPVILRTTLLPRLLSLLKFDYYWPEFLHERRAVEEFLNPEVRIVGLRKKNFPFDHLFKNIYYCTPEEASHLKYLHNIWNALRIAFVNEFGDNLIKENIAKENVLDFYFKGQKYLKWGNAFTGFCLPKDCSAYLKEYPNLDLLKTLLYANDIHRKKYPELDIHPVF